MLLENVDTKKIALAVVFGFQALVPCGVSADVVAAEQRKQVEVITTNDYGQATLESLVTSSDAVIVGRVTAGRPFMLDDRVVTDYDVTVDRVVRLASSSRVSVGGVVVVRRPVGTVTTNRSTMVSHEAGFPPFMTGTVYVLFLARGEGGAFYVVNYGAQGAFGIANGIVRQLSEESPLWSQERGPVTFDRFLQDVQKVPFTRR